MGELASYRYRPMSSVRFSISPSQLARPPVFLINSYRRSPPSTFQGLRATLPPPLFQRQGPTRGNPGSATSAVHDLSDSLHCGPSDNWVTKHGPLRRSPTLILILGRNRTCPHTTTLPTTALICHRGRTSSQSSNSPTLTHSHPRTNYSPSRRNHYAPGPKVQLSRTSNARGTDDCDLCHVATHGTIAAHQRSDDSPNPP